MKWLYRQKDCYDRYIDTKFKTLNKGEKTVLTPLKGDKSYHNFQSALKALWL